MKRGAAGFKHFDTKDVWGQELVKQLGVKVHRISRELNVADAVASPSPPGPFHSFIARVGVVSLREGDDINQALDGLVLDLY